MRRHWLPLALCALCSLHVATAGAKEIAAKIEPQYIPSLRNYGPEQGLPQASVNAIRQTRDGYLWIATFGGLVRFDGLNFTAYQATPGGLTSNRITDLYQDPRGRLWIATQDGGIVVYANGHFQPLAFCRRSCHIQSLRPSADGRTLWLEGPTGIFEFDLETLKYRQRSTQLNAFTRIAPMADGDLYASGRQGLVRIGADDVTSIPLPANSAAGIRAMASSGHFLWLISDTDRLYRYDTRDGSWLQPRTHIPQLMDFPRSNTDDVYLSMENGQGTWRLQIDGTMTPLLPHTPTVLYARVMYADNEGNTWIGSDTQGLWRMRAAQVGLMASAGMNLPARALTEDGTGGMWFGMNCGLFHWTRQGDIQQVDLHALGGNCVQSLLLDKQSRLWISTPSDTLGWLQDGKVVKVGAWPQYGQAVNIWQDPDNGQYWFNSSRRNWRLDVDARGRMTGAHALPELDNMQIAQMTPSRRGGVWFVGNLGAYRIDHGKLVEQLSGRDNPDLRSLRWLHETADGSLWIGSYGNGLLYVHNGQVQRWDKHNGLFDDAISCVLEDTQGRLWLGSNNGIALLRRANDPARVPELRVLAASDGLVPAEMNGGTASSCLRDSRGRLWFALISGFAVVDPARFGDADLPPPPAHIDQLGLAGKTLDIAAPGKLGVDAHNLEINYDATSLAYPERLRFRYRITPGAGEWVDAGEHRNLLLPNLPWGKFRFEVQARLPDSAWSTSAAIELERPTPWYRWKLLWLLVSFGSLVVLLWATGDSPQEERYRRILEEVRATMSTQNNEERKR